MGKNMFDKVGTIISKRIVLGAAKKFCKEQDIKIEPQEGGTILKIVSGNQELGKLFAEKKALHYKKPNGEPTSTQLEFVEELETFLTLKTKGIRLQKLV